MANKPTRLFSFTTLAAGAGFKIRTRCPFEFLCKEAGVKVHYCAELFANNGEISSAILKTLKRVMAGGTAANCRRRYLQGWSAL